MTVTLAALLAVLGIAAVLVYVQKANQRAIQGMKTEWVLVAKAPIPSGTSAGQADRGGLLKAVQLPASSVPGDVVHKVTPGISNLVTSSAVQPGQLLLREMFVRRRQVTGAIGIPNNKVAVSLEVCLAADVAGYVKPGNFVAVYNTYGNGTLQQSCSTHEAQNAKSFKTQMVLPKVEVLSVIPAQSAQGSTSGSAPVVSGPGSSAASQGAVFITLAASEHDAKLLILLSEAGLPYFALTTPSSGISTDPTPAQLFTH